MTQIRFHVEGGAGKARDIEMRQAFRKFFAGLDPVARERNSSLRFVLHGSRRETYQQFCHALKREPEAYHVLLVNSEDPVTHWGDCWRHLQERPADGWERPAGTDEAQCQLMVQAVEAWFFADLKRLTEYYGKGFQVSSLSNRQNVEEIPKSEHLPALEAATKQSQKKRYHKTQHLPEILDRIDAHKVRERAWRCDQIFVSLSEKLGAKMTPLCRLTPEP